MTYLNEGGGGFGQWVMFDTMGVFEGGKKKKRGNIIVAESGVCGYVAPFVR